jgi:hypothetical protein
LIKFKFKSDGGCTEFGHRPEPPPAQPEGYFGNVFVDPNRRFLEMEQQPASSGSLHGRFEDESSLQDRISRSFAKSSIRAVLLLFAVFCLVLGLIALTDVPKSASTTEDSTGLSAIILDEDGDDNDNNNENNPDEIDWHDTPERRNFLASVRADLPEYVSRDMDFTVDPCENFYEHVCGAWMQNATIPGHLSSFDR